MARIVVNPSRPARDQPDGLHLVFAGAEGLGVFAGGTASSPDPARFHAESVVTDYGGVIVSRLRSTPCRIERERPLERFGDGIEVMLVLEGSLEVGQGGPVGRVGPGDLLATWAGGRNFLAASRPFEIAWLHLPASRMPARMLQPDALPTGALPQTRLSASVAAFLRRLASGPVLGNGPDRVYLARAVAELAVAVLAEAMDDRLPTDRPAELRQQVRDHIEHHLAEADLGPQRIAEALGISVRWVHRVFNVEDETVARYIRERRLDAVAHLLQAERHPQRVGALAERFGFSGRDHLTRAFRQRYGVTLREYQDAAASGALAGALAGSGSRD